MGHEEQVEEREVLASIFPDEITDIDETSYRVLISLDDIPREDADDNSPTLMNLTVRYLLEYPDIAPILSLSWASPSTKFPYLSFPSDESYLLSTLDEPITENLGQAMIFTLISTLKDATESLIRTRIDDANTEADKERAKAEEIENAKFVGEQVTREIFLIWREGFRAEMAEADIEKKRMEEERKSRRERVKEEEAGKMTGRELWEKGLVGKIEEDDEEDALSRLQTLKITGTENA